MKSNIDPFYLIKQGKFNEAIKIYSEELKRELSSPIFTNRGLAYINIGDLDNALDDTE
jgi:tetratricopeptide (TPR) repeat protein